MIGGLTDLVLRYASEYRAAYDFTLVTAENAM